MATFKPWVVNASPLILLGKLKRLDLLERMAPVLQVPEAVIREVSMGGRHHDPAANATAAWAQSYLHPDVAVLPTVAHWDLGTGESQVISLCLNGAAVAVLDDGEARACARAHELPLIGTLGVILRARKLGVLPAARPLIDQLLAAGSYLDRALVERELAKLGE
jgi:predicted nucleic acid-binding protein